MNKLLGILAALVLLAPGLRAQETDKQAKLDPGQVQQWIDALGSREFAARERAADSLVSFGIAAVPLLEKAHQQSVDPEVKLRTEKLIHQLRSGSQEARIESFLAGEDIPLENWGIIKAIFGDSPKSRDVYVELLQAYPELVSALDGTSRELVVAMDTVSERIINNRSKLGWQPRASDALAMLLPATDENVPVSVTYENLMLYLLRLSPVNRVPKDNVLGQPFSALLGTWMNRSRLSNRQSVLHFAMEWDLDQSYGLALNTLGETTDTETLSHAMQVIAKYGKKTDSAFLLPFLDDSRPASERRFVRGRVVKTELRDVAVAAIAILNEVPMEEIGLDESVKHEKYGFIYEEVGFPPGDNERREQARKKIEEVIADRLNDQQIGS